jgi:membrane protein DedA with SNARE-associated domain
MIDAFIRDYGYLAVFAGTFLEGETILLAAGYAAHRGLLDLPTVMLIATLGGTLGDQTAFFLGRWRGDALIARLPLLARQRHRVYALLARHSTLLILGVRFLYGLRIAGPILMGASAIDARRFALLNFSGAMLWAVAIAVAGYAFGIATAALLADIDHLEWLLLLIILASGGLVGLWHGLRAWRCQRATAKSMTLTHDSTAKHQ